MSRKVFTAGEVLAAADVNNFLMNQTVMSFAGTASRAASIPTPIEGMYTNLEDTDDLQFWNGSAWVSPFGLTRLVNQNVTASSGYAVDNVFTSQFPNYKVVIKVDAMSAGNIVAMNMQYRRAGVTQTATNYYAGTFYMSIDGGATGVFTRSNGAGNIYLGACGVPSTPSLFNLDIFSPNVSTTFTQHTLQAMTHYNGTSVANSSNVPLWGGGTHNVNTDLDGIILTPGSGTWTGNVKIYGYRN